MNVSVVLADDHTLFSEGLSALLQLEGLDVAAICTDGDEALEAVERYSPDVLIIDQAMPGLTGLDVVEELHKRGSETREILLAASLPDEVLLAAMRLDVPGLLLKESAATDLVECIRKVVRGENSRDPEMVERALALALDAERLRTERQVHLTPRQKEILGLLSKGLPNKRIAHQLDVSEGTVKAHVHHLFRKLNVSSRVQLALRATEWSLGSEVSPGGE